MGFEVFTVATLQFVFFWIVTLCGLAGGYHQQLDTSNSTIGAQYFEHKSVKPRTNEGTVMNPQRH
jgi:hypothetical protein